jgi:hypothetical protein
MTSLLRSGFRLPHSEIVEIGGYGLGLSAHEGQIQQGNDRGKFQPDQVAPPLRDVEPNTAGTGSLGKSNGVHHIFRLQAGFGKLAPADAQRNHHVPPYIARVPVCDSVWRQGYALEGCILWINGTLGRDRRITFVKNNKGLSAIKNPVAGCGLAAHQPSRHHPIDDQRQQTGGEGQHGKSAHHRNAPARAA